MDIPSRVALKAATRFTVVGECFVSTYSVLPQGYAQIGWQEGGVRHGTTAHRAAYVAHAGHQIPDGVEIDHIDSCRNRRCVRREHLRELIAIDNSRRNGPGRDFPVGWICKRNHPASAQIPLKRKTKKGETRIGFTCGECMRESREKYVRQHPDRVKATQSAYAKRQWAKKKEAR